MTESGYAYHKCTWKCKWMELTANDVHINSNGSISQVSAISSVPLVYPTKLKSIRAHTGVHIHLAKLVNMNMHKYTLYCKLTAIEMRIWLHSNSKRCTHQYMWVVTAPSVKYQHYQTHQLYINPPNQELKSTHVDRHVHLHLANITKCEHVNIANLRM